MTTLAKIGPAGRTSLADSVYQTILEAIFSGALAPGLELSEVALAADLGVSRTPVHEALKRLAQDGLVEHMNNRQARVVRLSSKEIMDIYDLRLLLEPVAAERAARRLEPTQREMLREAAEVLKLSRNSRTWSDRAIEFDIRFHDILAAASGNERLQAEIAKYRRLVRALCRVTGSMENLEHAFQEHLTILQALEARDGRAARKAMADHIQARLESVLRHMDAQKE